MEFQEKEVTGLNGIKNRSIIRLSKIAAFLSGNLKKRVEAEEKREAYWNKRVDVTCDRLESKRADNREKGKPEENGNWLNHAMFGYAMDKLHETYPGYLREKLEKKSGGITAGD